jgi:hypothetical protein
MWSGVILLGLIGIVLAFLFALSRNGCWRYFGQRRAQL